MIWLLLPVIGAIIAATLEPIPPHDYWWHLAMGRLIDGGTLPQTNLFLYTLPVDLPFVDQPWLGQWLMWVAYDAAGHTGTILLRNGILTAAMVILLASAYRRCRDARAVGALGLVAVMVAYPVLTVRTRMFAFLPFALVLWVCFGVADGYLRRRWLALVPVVTVFWANSHGSFVLAGALVLAVGLGVILQQLLAGAFDKGAAATWLGTLAATTLAGAVSPLGFGVYAYVIQLTVNSSVASSVTEWRPPDIGGLSGQLFFAIVVAALAIFAHRRRDVSLSELFVFAGTLFLAAGAVRSAFWWAAVLPVVLAPHLSSLLVPVTDDRPGRAETVGLWIGLVSLLAGVLVVQPGAGRAAIGELVHSGQARTSGPGAWVLNHENAEHAVARIQADKRQRVFHDQVLGGMLEVALTDSAAQVAYVDQRMEFVPDDTWARYFALSRAQENWDRELARLGVDTLLLSPESQWPLIQAALRTEDWVIAEVDQSHLLMYRVDLLDRAQDPPK